jgi:hypothetical protein
VSNITLVSDPNVIRRLGNLTATSTSEVLVFGRTYAEPASEAQRSIVSTSAQDASAGSGAKAVRVTYLNSSYVRSTEDFTLNGTTAVNSVATDIRFIESMQVIQGAAAAGAITLRTVTGGGGTEIMGIASATSQTFAAHHYVPAGYQGIILKWSAVVDDEASMKLLAQQRFGSNLVDATIDLDKLFESNPTPPTRLSFEREFLGGYGTAESIIVPEKTYVRVTVVPNQATSTTIRATLIMYEQPL